LMRGWRGFGDVSRVTSRHVTPQCDMHATLRTLLATMFLSCYGSGMLIGERVRELRLKAGLNQDALAYTVGVATKTISSIETGRHQPKLRLVARIGAALGVELPDLVRGVDA
jgi:DNA-binding XRE family transcriptional regulator